MPEAVGTPEPFLTEFRLGGETSSAVNSEWDRTNARSRH